jgi:hypothetical protein
MTIIGYRPPTAQEVEGTRIANGIPAWAFLATLPDGSVSIYSPKDVVAVNPAYLSMTAAEQLAYLATNPGGVFIRVPLQPIVRVDSTPPAPPPPVVLPPPVPATPPANVSSFTAPSVAVSNFLQISTQGITRTYRKNSMAQLPSETITLKNIAQELSLTVALTGIAGVSFSPSTLVLAPQEVQTVSVNFDTAQINNLQEGISSIRAVLGIQSQLTFTQFPLPRIIPPSPQPTVPVDPDPPQPVVPEPVVPRADVPPDFGPPKRPRLIPDVPADRPDVPPDFGPQLPIVPGVPHEEPPILRRPTLPFPIDDAPDAPPILDPGGIITEPVQPEVPPYTPPTLDPPQDTPFPDLPEHRDPEQDGFEPLPYEPDFPIPTPDPYPTIGGGVGGGRSEEDLLI